LPMIPEALISMLACCRIGAIHSVVFSAFSADALKARIEDAKCKVLVTADGYYRRGKEEELLEKAKEAITEEEAQDLGRKFLKGEFNLIDLYEQMRALKKMGPLKKVMEMVPGLSQVKLPKEALQVQEKKLEIWRHVMDSMTKEELEDPDIVTSSRIERIAKGTGVSTQEVRGLLKQYRQSKKLVKLMKGTDSEKGMQKALQRLQKGGKVKFKL